MDLLRAIGHSRRSSWRYVEEEELKFRIEPREAILDLIPRNSVGAEIGVHLGNYSNRILRVVAPKKLHLIDPWAAVDDPKFDASLYSSKNAPQKQMDMRYEAVVERFKGKSNVIIHRSMSGDVAPSFPDEYFDWVYVDGDHTYEGVCADIKAYSPKLKANGLLIGDDYSLAGWWGRGVVDAFHDALASKAYILEFKLGSQIALRKYSV